MRVYSDDPALREQLRKEILEALHSEPPGDNPELALRSFGDVESQSVRYFLYVDVLEELVKAARYRGEAATAVLLGQFCVDDKGPFIEVTAFRDMEYLFGADAVEQTRVSVEKALEELDEAETGETHHVVGLFSARPGREAMLDPETARLHLSLFNLPFQVAVVVDGEQDRLGVYARKRGGTFFNAAFYVVEKRKRGCKEPSAGEETAIDDEDIKATSDGDDE